MGQNLADNCSLESPQQGIAVSSISEMHPPVPVRFRERAGLAIVIGLVAGGLCAMKAAKHAVTMDFEFFWRASRLFASGVNPYPLRPGDAGWPLPDALFYPAPALLVVWPLHWFIMPVAAALFFGGGSACLAWWLSKDGTWRLWLLGGPAFIIATILGQWSPLVTLGAIVPGAGFLLACKPTIGLACFAYRPSRTAALGVVTIALLSLVLLPSWPREWLENLQIVANHPTAEHPVPITKPLGWFLVLALARWRQPEARLLLAMACVPQLLYFADQLPLGLVARKRSEAVLLASCGLVAGLTWFILLPDGAPHVAPAARYVMLGLYLPALGVVLSRPNEGPAPAWLDARLAGFSGRFSSLTGRS